VKHLYLFSSPEAELEIVVKTRSENRDTARGRRREWVIDMGATQALGGTVKITRYGFELRDAFKDAGKALENWVGIIAAGKPEEAYRILEAPDARKKAHFDELYAALREGVPPTTATPLKLRQPLQLYDEKDGQRFTLTLRVVAENGPIDVEFDMRLESPDYEKGWTSWKIMDMTLLGTRKRANPADAVQAPGKVQGPRRPF
jgi:hypothetical protein